MPLGIGWGQNVGLGNFCHILILLPLGESVFHKHLSSFVQDQKLLNNWDLASWDKYVQGANVIALASVAKLKTIHLLLTFKTEVKGPTRGPGGLSQECVLRIPSVS